MTVRTIKKNDAAPVAALLSQTIAGGGHTTVSALTEALNTAQSIGLHWTDERGTVGAIVGHCIANEAEIHEVGIAPFARRQGLATALVGAFCRVAQQRGAAVCFLEVRANNTSAQHLYTHMGFEVCGRRKSYYSDGEDAVVMRRPLETDT